MHADYLSRIFENYEDVIKRMEKKIKSDKLDYTHVAFAGLSGISVGFAIASRLNKKPICCRKDHEECHSFNSIEFSGKIVDYIIVDDLVDSGKTVSFIKKRVESQGCGFYTRSQLPTLKGVYCYGRDYHKDPEYYEGDLGITKVNYVYDLLEPNRTD